MNPKRRAAGGLEEALWERYRSLADDLLPRFSCSCPETVRPAARGAMYLFIVDLIAQFLDAIEREPDESRRRAAIDVLLRGGKPPSIPSPRVGRIR